VMHLDKHLGNIIAEQGRGRAYALLAAIVFCETGLVSSLRHKPPVWCECQLHCQSPSGHSLEARSW
jgi:hypothetical protein